jgi:DNA modification methylase
MSVNIIRGNVLQVLPTLPDDHFDCVVTSPPYWGLRDYGVEGQIGLEPTMQGYLDTMVCVCRELRRVLKPEGTFWLNIGDSYASTPVGRFNGGGFKDTSAKNGTRDLSGVATSGIANKLIGSGLKNKDLCMIPNRLAIALQEDGWYVRSEIIWHKPNPMPESVRDRPTSAHEKVWLLTKSDKYFYDADAIAEDVTASTLLRLNQNIEYQIGSARGNGGSKANGNMKAVGGNEKRNSRNVWSITTKPFRGAHFATMPPELAERCIKAGCPVGGSVLDPFGGAGTTGVAANNLGRNATLIELNEKYVTLAEERIYSVAPLLSTAGI